MSKRHSFKFESGRCIKCYACEIACRQWHGIPAGSYSLRTVTEKESGVFPQVKRLFESVACRHCASAPCVAACPAGAIRQRDSDGIVVVDQDQCRGCRACLAACPFAVPQFDRDGIMHKCDMCLERVEQGQNPVCVDTCPTRALQWE